MSSLSPPRPGTPAIGAHNSTANSVSTGNVQYVQATLSESRAKSVKFSFPPEKLKLGITATVVPKPPVASTGSEATTTTTYLRTGEDIVAWGQLSLTVDSIYLVGTGTEVNNAITMVLGWADAFKSKTNAAPQTVLKFQLGSGSGAFDNYQVTLKSVAATIERYDQAGLPVRATLSLTMLLTRQESKATNPSSRGESGSSVHQVVDGESICGVAELTYGHPKYWRELAEANDIDDPLKARAGQSIYLPPPARMLGGPR